MKITTAWAIMWIAVSVAVIAAVALTGRTACLFAFLIPASISIKNSGGGSAE